MFSSIETAPPDPILGLTEAFKNDANPAKVNLGVGVFKDEQGQTPILSAVKKAEQLLASSLATKSYMPITGDPQYGAHVQSLILGEGHAALAANRVRTAHTPGGTGGLRVGADLLAAFNRDATIWVSRPTWANHKGIFQGVGFTVSEYAYYDADSKGLDFVAMCEDLRKVPAGDVVLLHVCCHNPSGVDLTGEQWKQVAGIAGEKGWIPFLDFAYQGFGQGLEEDRQGVVAMLESCDELIIASSFSKNFGLYQDRVGAFSIVAKTAAEADATFSQLKRLIRINYSNPPAHGAHVVNTVLNDAALREEWVLELAGMRARICDVRQQLVGGLKTAGAQQDFDFITKQTGMFSFSGLSPDQVKKLKEEKSIYIVGSGRINVAGITPGNLEYLCRSIVEVL